MSLAPTTLWMGSHGTRVSVHGVGLRALGKRSASEGSQVLNPGGAGPGGCSLPPSARPSLLGVLDVGVVTAGPSPASAAWVSPLPPLWLLSPNAQVVRLRNYLKGGGASALSSVSGHSGSDLRSHEHLSISRGEGLAAMADHSTYFLVFLLLSAPTGLTLEGSSEGWAQGWRGSHMGHGVRWMLDMSQGEAVRETLKDHRVLWASGRTGGPRESWRPQGLAVLLSASPCFGLMVVLGFPLRGARWAAQPSP